MLVDAHAHVWRAVPNYPEPAATTVSPVSDVPVEILDEYLTEYGVDRAVLVQPVYPGEDNGYVADCATADGTPFQLAVAPVQYGDEPASPARAPEFNEHGDAILESLGFDWDRIVDLKVRGVVS